MSRPRPCLDCGALSPNTRCPTHTRTTTQRGYGWTHQQARALALQDYDPDTPCPRCGLPLGEDVRALALDHNDSNRATYNGLAHALCNSTKRELGSHLA